MSRVNTAFEQFLYRSLKRDLHSLGVEVIGPKSALAENKIQVFGLDIYMTVRDKHFEDIYEIHDQSTLSGRKAEAIGKFVAAHYPALDKGLDEIAERELAKLREQRAKP